MVAAQLRLDSIRWSKWSNWAKGSPAIPLPPPPPAPAPGGTPEQGEEATPSPTPTGGGRSGCYEGAEIEGMVVAVDTVINAFAVRVTAYEHFGGNQPKNPVTVDYSAATRVEDWLLAGHYIEAEGCFDSSGNTLYAHQVERNDDRDNDDRDNDDRDNDRDDD